MGLSALRGLLSLSWVYAFSRLGFYHIFLAFCFGGTLDGGRKWTAIDFSRYFLEKFTNHMLGFNVF